VFSPFQVVGGKTCGAVLPAAYALLEVEGRERETTERGRSNPTWQWTVTNTARQFRSNASRRCCVCKVAAGVNSNCTDSITVAVICRRGAAGTSSSSGTAFTTRTHNVPHISLPTFTFGVLSCCNIVAIIMGFAHPASSRIRKYRSISWLDVITGDQTRVLQCVIFSVRCQMHTVAIAISFICPSY